MKARLCPHGTDIGMWTMADRRGNRVDHIIQRVRSAMQRIVQKRAVRGWLL